MKNRNNKCTFFNSSIYNSLYEHNLIPSATETSGSVSFYDHKETFVVSGSYSFKSDISDNLDESATINVWNPCFLTTLSPYGKVPIYNSLSPTIESRNREYTDPNCNAIELTTSTQKTLGIASFISISAPSAAFRDLNIVSYPSAESPGITNAGLGIDWYIADPTALKTHPQIGILFWYRKVKSDLKYKFKYLKPGTEFYLDVAIEDSVSGLKVPANTIFVKLDNHKIQMMPYKEDKTGGLGTILGNDSVKVEFSPPAGHNLEGVTLANNVILDIRNINDINKYVGGNRKHTDYTSLENFWENNLVTNHSLERNYIKKGASYFDIHIPEADVFSYFIEDDLDNGGARVDNFVREYLPEALEEKYRLLYRNLSNLSYPGSKLRAENLKRICSYLATGPMFTDITLNLRGFYYYNGGASAFNWTTYLNNFLDFDFSVGRVFNSAEFITRLKQLSFYIYQDIKNAAGVDHNSSRQIAPNSDYTGEKRYGMANYIYQAILKKNDMYMAFNSNTSGAIEIDKNLYTKYINGPHIKLDLGFTPYIQPSLQSYTSSGSLGGIRTYDQYIQAGPLKFRTKMVGDASSDGLPLTYFEETVGGYSLPNVLDGYKEKAGLVDDQNIFIIHPDVKTIGFYKQGAFKIDSSNCYVKELSAQSAIDNGKLDEKPIFLDRDELAWGVDSYGSKSYSVSQSDTTNNKVLFGFDVGSSSYIKLYRIYARWYRYNSEELCSCPSFYEEVLNYTKQYTGSTAVGDGLAGPQDGAKVGGGSGALLAGSAGSGAMSNSFSPVASQDIPRGVGFGRVGYCSRLVIGSKPGGAGYNDVYLPGVNNKYSPPIKSYGGYSRGVINALGIKMPKHPAVNNTLPILSHRNEIYDENIKCYMRSGAGTDESLPIIDYTQAGILSARKGIFHPYFGWIDIQALEDNTELTPLKNKTFVNSKKITLKGVGLLFKNNSEYDSRYYSSRIRFAFEGDADDDDYYQYGTGRNSYSYLSTKFSDDMRCEECIPAKNCDAVTAIERAKIRDCVNLNSMGIGYIDSSATAKDLYQPAVSYTLPNNSLLKQKISNDATITDADIKIQDISVKINFLNYPNPQDLKITLYTNLSTSFTSSTDFFTESDLVEKLGDLEAQNPANAIVLFNREHIDNYEKDFCITFSDNAPKNNVFSISDSGVINVGIESWKFNRVKSGGIIRPTIKTDGETEAKHYVYKNILLNNEHDPVCNKFAKWRGSALDGVSFKLVVEIFNNYDEKNYSSYILPDFLNEENDGKFKSSIFANNICNFEIVIDTDEAIDNINHPITKYIDYKDSFKDYINYGTGDDQGVKRSGYNYLINFNENTKYLLPPINSHAPFNSVTNHNTCILPDEQYNTHAFVRVPSLSNIILTTGLGLSFAATGLQYINFGDSVRFGAFVGAIGLGAIATGANMILNAFANKRRERSVNAYDESFYIEEYSKRDGFGTPDKALIDISADGYTWYTFDAQIFKFDELSSPIYKPKILEYKKEKLFEFDDAKSNGNDRAKIRSFTTAGLYSVFEGSYVKINDLNINKNTSTVIDLPLIDWSYKHDQRDAKRQPYAIDLTNRKTFQINHKFYGLDTDYTTGNFIKVNDSVCFNILRKSLDHSAKIITFGENSTTVKLDVQGIIQTPEPSTEGYSTYIKVADSADVDFDFYEKFYLGVFEETKSAVVVYPWDTIPSNSDVDIEYYTDPGPARYLQSDKIYYPNEYPNKGQQEVFQISGHQAAYGEGSWGTGTPLNYKYGKYIVIPQDYDVLDTSSKTQSSNNGGLIYSHSGWFINNSTRTILSNTFTSLNYTRHSGGIPNKNDKQKNQYYDINDTAPGNNGYLVSENIKERSANTNKYENILLKGTPSRLANSDLSQIDTEYSDYKYWINIDGNQKGRLSKTNSVRVLKKIEYSCYEINNDKNLNCINVCGDSPGGGNSRDTDGDGPPVAGDTVTTESLKQKTTSNLYNQVAPLNDYGEPSMVFTNTDAAIAAQKALYPGATWKEQIIEKANLRLSCGYTNVDTILRVREYYDMAVSSTGQTTSNTGAGVGGAAEQATNTATRTTTTSVQAVELIDASTLMENTNDLKIRFVHWPRKLKNLDLQFDSYTPNTEGDLVYRGRNKFTDGMNIKNLFYSWICGASDESKTKPIQPVVPPYYKILNEMVFRAFYGSQDQLEFKKTILETKDDFEWIPYEYDSSIDCTATSEIIGEPQAKSYFGY